MRRARRCSDPPLTNVSCIFRVTFPFAPTVATATTLAVRQREERTADLPDTSCLPLAFKAPRSFGVHSP